MKYHDVQEVYEFEDVDKNHFPTLQAYADALNGFSIDDKKSPSRNLTSLMYLRS